jgi:hypothetical protein
VKAVTGKSRNCGLPTATSHLVEYVFRGHFFLHRYVVGTQAFEDGVIVRSNHCIKSGE